ncbi:MAG TPA: heparinase II/III family protein [Bauldia sp.]|nr:heparinase II/III family protein [Bauldia sp.]
MAIGSASGPGRQLRFAFSAGRRALAYRFHASFLYRWRFAGQQPERLTIAPIDLRTADPTVALDIYAGRWVFNGDGVDIEGFSVFDAEPPNEEWARQLHSFGWLRHLRASDMALSRSNARSLVDEWIRFSSHHDKVAWNPEIVARRLMAWLSQTPLVLEGCDFNFYRRFMRSLGKQLRYLRRVAHDAGPGLPRLRVMIALAAMALSIPEQQRFLKQAQRRLDVELVAQILPDGGHVSRNPGVILELLVELLPLRQAFIAKSVPPSRILLSAIDRMMPMLRFFRQGDGSFTHFNGMGDTATDQLATILAYDDARAAVPANAPHSGYQRVEASGTIVVVDAGRPPPPDFSVGAHAGCLSFEMSVGRQRLIVNCGVPKPSAAALRRLARTTAAHSTVTINDTSSCRILNRGVVGEVFGEAVVAGPNRIDVARRSVHGATELDLRHNGYVDRYRLVHERQLSLSDAGDRLEGMDTFVMPNGDVSRSGKDSFAIRFHLHPNVRAIVLHDRRAVLMELPDGESWEFETDGPEIAIEESILLSDNRGNRATEQVVIYGRVQQTPRVQWTLHRTALAGRRARTVAASQDEFAR